MPVGRKPTVRPDAAPLTVTVGPPSWLGKDAKAEWRRVMPELVERKILTNADLGTLEAYAIAIGTIRECERLLQAEGLVVMGSHGPKRHPAQVIQKDAMSTAIRMAGELGLTPVSRSRPSVRDDADDGLLDD